jgi:CHAD domain-containing protein
MSFKLKQGERIDQGVRRIVCKRIESALAAMRGKTRNLGDASVHDARKRFKEIRGALRLVRDELGEKQFRRENETFRDAGRPLSALRDAKVLVDTLDGLIAHFNGRVKPAGFASLRRILLARRRAKRTEVLERDHAVSKIVKSIRQAKKRVDDWPLRHGGWRAIEPGVKQVYGQGRRAMRRAMSDPCDETLHEWRKRGKDLRYQMELLEEVWPETMRTLAEQAHHLTDILGEDHDLAVLRATMQEEDISKTPVDGELLVALIDERRCALQREACELGEKLYREHGKTFVGRLKGYWKAAKDGEDAE